MPIRQFVDAASAAKFNKFGYGRVHMDFCLARAPAAPTGLRETARRLIMGARIISRVARGVAASPTQVAAGTGVDWAAVDGLDVTVDTDTDLLLVDFAVSASFSASPGTVLFSVRLDGQALTPDQVTHVYTGTAAAPFAGSFAVVAGAGAHRVQLMATAANAITITYSGTSRTMRVTGLAGTL